MWYGEGREHVAPAVHASQDGAVAQRREQRFPKPCVAGSNPVSPTLKTLDMTWISKKQSAIRLIASFVIWPQF
jgi:hypothetical protein